MRRVSRGWGRSQERLRLEQAWNEAAGAEHARHTRIGSLRRGTLEVIVDNAVLLQELAGYHKRRLLAEVRKRLPGATIHDIRFRAGVVNDEEGGH